MFLNFGSGNGIEKQCSKVLGLGMGIKIVFPTKIGIFFIKSIGKKLGAEVLALACMSLIYDLQSFESLRL